MASLPPGLGDDLEGPRIALSKRNEDPGQGQQRTDRDHDHGSGGGEQPGVVVPGGDAGTGADQPHAKNSTSQHPIASLDTLYTGESTGICPVSFRYRRASEKTIVTRPNRYLATTRAEVGPGEYLPMQDPVNIAPKPPAALGDEVPQGPR